MELGDGQSQRIDELILWVDFGLIADLFGIQVVRDTEHPMLRAWLPRVAWGVQLVQRE